MRPLLFVTLVAGCWHGSTAPAKNSVDTSPAPVVVHEPTSASIAREEMLVRSVTDNDPELGKLLVGRWDGKRYGYNGDSPTFEGEEGDSPRERWNLSSSGEYVVTGKCPSAGRYGIERDEGNVTLTLEKTRSCAPGAKTLVYYVHHLDDGILVLIDASTAGVVAFRRVD